MTKSESTLHDVAELVGVSTRTVSRVVNDEGGFSTATEQRVRAAIEQLGYRPNLLARGLITKRTNTIGIVGGSMTDPFFPELAEGAQRAAERYRLTTLFAATDDSVERQSQVIDSLLSRAVDGVILFPAKGRIEPVQQAADAGLDVVAINPGSVTPSINTISSDIEGGARLAVEHLLTRGRTRVAFLANASPHSQQRERGYRRALGWADEPLIVRAEPTAEGGRAGALEMLERWPDVDGVFAYNDLMAVGAMSVLHESRRSIPTEIAVAGFDNIGLTAYLNPPLTTVDLDQSELGRMAVELLVAAIDEPDRPARQLTHPARLMIRAST